MQHVSRREHSETRVRTGEPWEENRGSSGAVLYVFKESEDPLQEDRVRGNLAAPNHANGEL